MRTKIFTGVASLLMLIGSSAQAKSLEPFLLTQRNCIPGDLGLEQLSVPQTAETNCVWLKQRLDDQGGIALDDYGQPIVEDSDMQVTLFVKDNPDNADIYVQGRCVYPPAAANIADAIV